MFNKTIFSLCLTLALFSTSLYSKDLLLVTLENAPAEYSENGIAKGMNVDIVTEALRRMNYNAKIKFFPWKRALIMVKNGDADGIIDAAYNNDRAKYLHFPNSEIHTEEWFAFKKKNSLLSLNENLSNAKDIRIGLSRGFVYGGKIQEFIDNKEFKSIQEVYNNELNIVKLIANRFDMFIGLKSTILFLSKQMGYSNEVEIVKMTGTNKEYLLSSSKTFLAFSKKTIKKEFSDKFSKVIEEMKEEGTIKKIESSYYK